MSDDAGAMVRPYHPDDEVACRACVAELQDGERAFDARLRAGASIAAEYLSLMHARGREYRGVLLVAEQGGQVVGLAQVLTRVPFESIDDPPGEYALVAELVVRQAFRRQGIARALLAAAEDYARAAGAGELQIMVLSRNAPARTLYLSEGFVPYKETLAKSLQLARAQTTQ